jgi:hypothetical protein
VKTCFAPLKSQTTFEWQTFQVGFFMSVAIVHIALQAQNEPLNSQNDIVENRESLRVMPDI